MFLFFLALFVLYYHTKCYIILSITTVTGVCHGISHGYHDIQYAVEGCPHYSGGEAQTGYDSSFHIFAEELRVDLQHVCPNNANPVNCGP